MSIQLYFSICFTNYISTAKFYFTWGFSAGPATRSFKNRHTQIPQKKGSQRDQGKTVKIKVRIADL
jgi:hypothetical protein